MTSKTQPVTVPEVEAPPKRDDLLEGGDYVCFEGRTFRIAVGAPMPVTSKEKSRAGDPGRWSNLVAGQSRTRPRWPSRGYRIP